MPPDRAPPTPVLSHLLPGGGAFRSLADEAVVYALAAACRNDSRYLAEALVHECLHRLAHSSSR